MTVTSTTSRWEAVGNGSTTVFPYNNKIFADTDLKVYLDRVLQTLTTHYTVSGAGTDSGGNVTFVTPPGNGVSVVIVRAVANTQEIDYPPGGAFPANSTEDGLDRRTIISQQNASVLDQAIQYLESDAGLPSPILPTLDSLKGKYLRFNSATGAPEAGVFDSGTAVRTSQNLSGDGSTTAFVLSPGVTSASAADVYIYGVHQDPATYTISGATITFSEAPPDGTNNILVRTAEEVPFGTTSSDLVTHQPAGSGSVERTVQSVLRTYMPTLEDFGGGTAVADNAAAFQAAMDAGGRLYVPHGNIYNIKSAVTRTGGCHIVGGGILRWTDDSASYGLAVTLTDDETSAFYATIDGVQFQHARAGSGTALTIDGSAFTRREPPQINIQNCVFRGSGAPSATGWQHNIVLTGALNATVQSTTIVGHVTGTSPQPTYAGDGIRVDDLASGAHLTISDVNSFYLTNHVLVDGYEGVYLSTFNFVGGTTGVRTVNTAGGTYPHIAITHGHMNILNDCINLSDTSAVFIDNLLLWQGANTATDGTAIRLTDCADVTISNNNLRGGRALVDYYGILASGSTNNVKIFDNLAIDCIYLAWAQSGTDKIYAYNNQTKRENTNPFYSSWGVLYANTSTGNEVILDGEVHNAAFEGASSGVTGAFRRGNRFTFNGDYESTNGYLGHPAPNRGNSWQNALAVYRGTQSNPDTTALYARTAAFIEMHSNKVHTVDQSVWGNPYKTPALTVEHWVYDTFEGEANGGAFRAYSTNVPASATSNKKNLVGVSAVGQTNTGSGNDSWSVWGANIVAAQTSGNAPVSCVGIEVDINHISSATAATGPGPGNNYTAYWAQTGANGVWSTAAFYASRTVTSLGWNYVLYSATRARDWMAYLDNTETTTTTASGIYAKIASSGGKVMQLDSGANTQFQVGVDTTNPVSVRVGGALKALEVGAADSAGTGYRAVRVLN